MPRTSGRSSWTLLCPIFFRPSVRSVSRCFGLPPTPDLVWVTFTLAISVDPFRTRPEDGGRGDILDRLAATTRDLLRLLQALQRSHRGVHHVDRVGRAQRLGQYVMHAGALEHRTRRPAGDDTGTRRGRTEHHDASGLLALDGVRDRALDARDAEEVLLRLLDTLGDRRGNFLGLAVADTHGAVAIAHDDERREAEPAPALDDLGDAVDGHDPFQVLALLALGLRLVAPTVIATAALTAAALLHFSHVANLSVRNRVRPRERPQREQPRGPGTCCQPGRTRPCRRQPSSHVRRRACRPRAPSPTCRRRRTSARPRASTPTPACGRPRRR